MRRTSSWRETSSPNANVRIFTIEVTAGLKGESPDAVELMLPGGTTDDGLAFGEPLGTPKLEVGDHVLVFCRLRDLATLAEVEEPLGLRVAHQAGLYHRVSEGGVEVAYDAQRRPLTLDRVDGAVPAALAAPADVEVPDGAPEDDDDGIVLAPRGGPDRGPAAGWDLVVAAIAEQVAAAPPTARPALDLTAEVAP